MAWCNQGHAAGYREQYGKSELLREEQTRILEERVQTLKTDLDGERKEGQRKVSDSNRPVGQRR